MSAALLLKPAGERAFERLYKHHVQEVYRYTLAVLRNPADAEDITQSTFLNAYRAYQRGDRPERPRNWLLKIAHNECRQRFRTLARRPREVEWDERVSAPPLDETVPTAEDLREALSHLSFNQRSALVMRELEGRSYAEIGEILDLSVSAIETLLFRARRALREQLGDGLTCGEAESAIVKRMDTRLAPAEQSALRAHLRECGECAALERKHRAQRAAMKRLGAVQLPPSLASFLGGASSVTGGAIAGSGVIAKAAAVVAAGVVAGGVGHQAVEAVAAGEPRRGSSLPELRQMPRGFPDYGANAAPWSPRQVLAEAANAVATGGGPAQAGGDARVRAALRAALSRSRPGTHFEGPTAAPGSGSAPAVGRAARPAASGQHQTPDAQPESARTADDTANEVVRSVPLPAETPRVEVPRVEVPRVEVPRVEVPRVEVPQVEVPRVEVPRVETPRVETPPVNVPSIPIPPVEVPPLPPTPSIPPPPLPTVGR